MEGWWAMERTIPPWDEPGFPGPEDDALPVRRGREGAGFGTSSLADLLGECAAGALSQGSATTRAAAAWAKAAGETGSRHTCGIYLDERTGGSAPDGSAPLPVLIVYLDGHSFVYEFATDHLLYEQRMAYLGFPVERIEFRLSRAPARRVTPTPPAQALAQAPAPARTADPAPAAPARADVDAWAKGLVEDLPGPLADAILGAIRATQTDQGNRRADSR